MGIDLFAQVIVIALLMAVIYGLIALGLAVVFSVLNVVNFAHGEFYMLGAFAAYCSYQLAGAGYWWWFPLVIVGGALLGALVERGIFSPLRRYMMSGIIASFGLALVLQQVAMAIWGPADKVVPPIVRGSFQLGTVFVSYERLIIAIIGAVLIGATLVIIHKTRVGRAIRAVAQNRDSATIHGINANQTRIVAMMLGSTLAVTGGFILASIGYINPYLGENYVLKAFMIIVIGGLGSIHGAIFGAIFLAFIDAFGTVLIGLWSPLIAFVVLALVLLFKPFGLWGFKEMAVPTGEEEVE